LAIILLYALHPFDPLFKPIVQGLSPGSVPTSYMAGRDQQVQVGSKLSAKRSVEVGVPQGSVLGPLLFLLYISDIHEWVGQVSVVGFADDTTVSFSYKSISHLVESLEREAKRVLE
jgi:hypothetical protein